MCRLTRITKHIWNAFFVSKLLRVILEQSGVSHVAQIVSASVFRWIFIVQLWGRAINFSPYSEIMREETTFSLYNNHYTLSGCLLDMGPSTMIVPNSCARIRAYRHLETFDPGTAYIYKCDLLVRFMPHDVWLMKLTRRSHLYMYGVPGSKVSRCL